MILARLTRSFRDYDWFTAAVELVLLVVGVFAGFQLDRWNEGRLDQQRADEYREQLITDLSIEWDKGKAHIAYYEQVRSYALAGLSAWSDNPQKESNAKETIVALYQASNVLPATSLRGAYDALLSNGLVERLGGPEITSRLSAYYGQEMNSVFNEVKRYRMELRGVMPITLQDKIRAECIYMPPGGSFMEQLRSDCDLGIEEDEAEQVLARIVAHPRMATYLQQSIARDSVSIYLLSAKQEVIHGLVEDLRSLGQ